MWQVIRLLPLKGAEIYFVIAMFTEHEHKSFICSLNSRKPICYVFNPLDFGLDRFILLELKQSTAPIQEHAKMPIRAWALIENFEHYRKDLYSVFHRARTRERYTKESG